MWLRKYAVDMVTHCPGDQWTASSSQLLQGVPQLQRAATLHQVPSHGSTHPMADEAGIKVQLFWPHERHLQRAMYSPNLLEVLPAALLGCFTF